VIAGGGVLCWQAYRVITTAEMFQVAGVDVKGVKQLKEADLKDIVSAFKGKNIFKVDFDAAIKRARGNAWVKEARIFRRLPNRISMVFTERSPFVVLDNGSARYLLDDTGVVIDSLAAESAGSWPLPVVAIKNEQVRPGDQITSEEMREAYAVISAISSRGGWQLADVLIKAGSPESLVVVHAEQEFKIGSGNYAEKLRRLAEIMTDVNQRGLEIAYVDLRPERQAAVMVKKNNTTLRVQRTESKGKRR
jgi:cell division septal protein FtsQ